MQAASEEVLYHQLREDIGWFFFDLLILGYVEDNDSGLSFHLPGKMGWRIYVEVPSRSSQMSTEITFQKFCVDFPIFNLVGTAHLIRNEIPLSVNKEVQLVCKYLKAYKEKRIDRLYKNGML